MSASVSVSVSRAQVQNPCPGPGAGQSVVPVVGSACSLIGSALVRVCMCVSVNIYMRLWVCILSETFCYHNYGGQGCQGIGSIVFVCQVKDSVAYFEGVAL